MEDQIIGRQRPFALRLNTPDGHIAFPYDRFTGAPFMKLDETTIILTYSGRMSMKRTTDGDWIAFINGKRLGAIYAGICAGTRAEVSPCEDQGDGSPVVVSVKVMEDRD